MLFVVELHCLTDPLQPGLLKDGQLLAGQIVAFQQDLSVGQNVALLAQFNPHHIHQGLNMRQLIVFVHLLVYVAAVLDDRRTFTYLKLLLKVFILGGELVFAVGVEAVPLLVDFIVLKGLFVFVDDAEALLSFLQLEGVVEDLLRNDLLLQTAFLFSRNERFCAFEHPKHRLTLLLWPADGLLVEKFLYPLILSFPLFREEVQRFDESLLDFLVALSTNGLKLFDLRLLLYG